MASDQAAVPGPPGPGAFPLQMRACPAQAATIASFSVRTDPCAARAAAVHGRAFVAVLCRQASAAKRQASAAKPLPPRQLRSPAPGYRSSGQHFGRAADLGAGAAMHPDIKHQSAPAGETNDEKDQSGFSRIPIARCADWRPAAPRLSLQVLLVIFSTPQPGPHAKGPTAAVAGTLGRVMAVPGKALGP